MWLSSQARRRVLVTVVASRLLPTTSWARCRGKLASKLSGEKAVMYKLGYDF